MDKIAVLDFGGQYAHLIANRIRRLGVYSEIQEAETKAEDLKHYKGIILSGGPSSVNDAGSPECDPEIFNLGIPVLAICYGHQLMVKHLGGKVESGAHKEYGYASLNIHQAKGIFSSGLEKQEQVWMSHGDTVTQLPEGFVTLGSSEDCEQAAIGDLDKNLFGIQFHAEVTHTPHGMNIFSNFVELCGVAREWSIQNFLDEQIEEIKNTVKDKKVFLMVSGGVDSTVAFALLEKALGPERVYGLFVDTGFMRFKERVEIEAFMKAAGFTNLHAYDASEMFFEGLKEIYEPEEKRKIIGKLFLEVQAKAVKDLGLNPDDWLLAQGTIYPDTIETGGTKHADKIKTHHNRVEEIQKLIEEGKVIEPLKDLYKDEVRDLGALLGLSHDLVWRHPFPGPGLAVRCLCNDKEAEDLYPTSRIEDEKAINQLISQYGLNALLLPIKSVGVQGDARTYRHPVVIFGAEQSFATLDKISTQITNRFASVNRVLYSLAQDINNIKLVNAYLTPNRIEVLQKADKIVHDSIKNAGLNKDIWQFPVVLLPLMFNNVEQETIVLRPVCSTEAMTADFYKMDLDLLREISKEITATVGIESILYDITNKPPATIEWE